MSTFKKLFFSFLFVVFFLDLLTVPPGFKEGMTFETSKPQREKRKKREESVPVGEEVEPVVEEEQAPTIITLSSLLNNTDDVMSMWNDETPKNDEKKNDEINLQLAAVPTDEDEENIIPQVKKKYYPNSFCSIAALGCI